VRQKARETRDVEGNRDGDGTSDPAPTTNAFVIPMASGDNSPPAHSCKRGAWRRASTHKRVGAVLAALVLVPVGSGCASTISDMVIGPGTTDSFRQSSQFVELDTEPREASVVDSRDGRVLGSSRVSLPFTYAKRETRSSSCGWRATFGVVDVIVGAAVAAGSTYGLVSYELAHQEQSSTDPEGMGIMALGLFGAIAGGVDLVFGGYHAADACDVRDSVDVPETHALRLRFEGQEEPFLLTVPVSGPRHVYLGKLDENAWAKATQTDSVKAYEWYLAEFPSSGKWRQEAQSRLEEISWLAATAQGTPVALVDHLKKFPNGAHRGHAKDALEQYIRTAPERLDVDSLEWLLAEVGSLEQLVALELVRRGSSKSLIAERLENPFVAERDRSELLTELKFSTESRSRAVSENARAALCEFASSDLHIHTSGRCRECIPIFRVNTAKGSSHQVACTDTLALHSFRSDYELDEFLARERLRDRSGCEDEREALRAKEKLLREEALGAAGSCP